MKKMKTKITAALAIIFTLTLAGCGGANQQAATKSQGIGDAASAKVETASIASVEEFYEAAGTVQSKTVSVLSSRTFGQVSSVRVKEGDLVRSGRLLVEIDDREAAAGLRKAAAGLSEARNGLEESERAINAAESAKAAAEASRSLASATYERYKALLQRQSVSNQEYDEVESRYRSATAETDRAEASLQMARSRKSQIRDRIEQAEADVSAGRVHLSYPKIVSPINGVVAAKSVEVGTLAAPGTPLLKIEDAQNYRLEAAVEESRFGLFKINDEVKVKIDALGDERIIGKISEISPVADPSSRSFVIKIDLPNNARLRSGMFGRAQFQTGTKQTLTVPASAIVEQGQLIGVYIADQNNNARLRLVKTGKLYGDRIEILSGLRVGDRVIVKTDREGRETREGAEQWPRD